MRDNWVKRRLQSGEVVVGTVVFEFNTAGLPRIAAAAGADFFVLDQEHAAWTADGLRPVLAAARAVEPIPIVRIPAPLAPYASQALDLGAMGILVPMVRDAAQAREIVGMCKYPPKGLRGAAFGVAHDDYVEGDVNTKMEQANAGVLLIAMIETVGALEQVRDIAAVDGLDVLWVGHFDLTASMGMAGNFDHPNYNAALVAVADACQQHGKAAGIMVADANAARHVLELGFRCIAYNVDIAIYRGALHRGLTEVRAAVETGEPELNKHRD
jgi:2-keto-3-deoxy-L-rhamnonate aldolase RhmA